MQPAIRNSIARIDVMQQGRSISRGTGFVVAEGLVLTALHVVADRTQQALAPYAGEIVLTFPGVVAKAAVDPDLWDRLADWVLLRFEIPASAGEAPRPVPLAELRDDGATWETFGFPDANPRDGMVNVGAVSNHLATLEGSPVFQLFSREAAAGEGAPVKGLSGSPVIVQNAVVGLLRFALMKEGQTVAGTVYACPIAPVLAKSGNLLPLPDPCFGLPGLPRQPLPAEPFRHLAWFTAKEAEVFFGRNREIREMYQRLTADDASPILLLYGQAGVGKSSFLDAGLLPRLRWYHQVCYLRRDPRNTLSGTLLEGLRLLGGGGETIEQAWLAAEHNSGKPLVVIFDQVEEVFTHPNSGAVGELDAFIKQLPAGVRGKLVLSFRKEWFPELQKQMEVNGLAYGKVFLEGLDRAAVLEAVSGLTLTDRLRQFYGLTVEPGTAEQIAVDLLADRDSPIAPTLQILLTKMWKRAVTESRNAPRMTLEGYRDLKKDGVLLGDFLDQQLEALRAAHAEWVESGLALDLLAFHTTSSMTARECSLEELMLTYKHRAGDLPALLQEFEVLFLLSDSSRDDDRKGTRLCHDTLAPLVRQRYAKSENPGQRARRILESRAEDWQEGNTSGLLDEGSLEAVERGAAGMRLLTVHETKLIEASRAEARRRRRTRVLIRAGGAIAVAAVLVASAFAGLEGRKAIEQGKFTKMELAMNDSGRLMSDDPVKGLELAVATVGRALAIPQGLENGQLDTKVQAALDSALNGSPEETYFAFPAYGVAWSPNNLLGVAGPGNGSMKAELRNGSGQRILQSSDPYANSFMTGISIALSRDGKLMAVTQGSNLILWNPQGTKWQSPIPGSGFHCVALTPSGTSILAGTSDGRLQSWSLSGRLQAERVVMKIGPHDPANRPGVQALAAASTPRGDIVVVSGGSDDALRFWNEDLTPLGDAVQEHGDAITAVDIKYRPDGSARILSGSHDGAVVLLDGNRNPVRKAKYDSMVCSVALNTQLTLGAVMLLDGSIHILDAATGAELFPPIRPDVGECQMIAFDPSGTRLVSGGSATHVLNLERGNLAATFPVSAATHLNHVVWSPNGRFVAVAPEVGGWFALLDTDTGALRKIDYPPVGGHDSSAAATTALSFNSDGTRVATAINGAGHVLRVWDIEGNQVREFQQNASDVPLTGIFGLPGATFVDSTIALRFTRDGRSLLAAGVNAQVTIWDLEAGGSRVLSLDSVPSAPLALVNLIWPLVTFNPDGTLIATGSYTNGSGPGCVRIWDAFGRLQEGPLAVTGLLRKVAFSAKGDSLFVWTDKAMLRWHLNGGKVVAKTPDSFGTPLFQSAVLSPDHHSAFLGGQNGITVWSTVTGEQITSFVGNTGGTLDVDVSPDGSTLASVGADGSVRLWRAGWRQWLETACLQLSGNPDFVRPSSSAASGRSAGARDSRLLRLSVSYEDENMQIARQVCRDQAWRKER